MRIPGEVVTLTVDGQEVSAVAGQTVLDVARENGINIPTLCQLDGLHNIGACRLCLVEVKGNPKLLSSCTTDVADGMDIRTATEKLQKYRKMILEMLFAERNHVCSVCVSNNHCELQDLAQSQGVDHIRFPYRYPTLPVDASHERFVIDHNRCILCTRCVRVCDEIEGAHTWDIFGRGVNSLVITDLNQPWGTSETCTNCSKCVHVCPTGALFEKGVSVAEMHKRKQFLPYLSLMRGEK
ncbi:MAG: bidirectional hydrogenase complex protein HoxU [Armatimonadota bacterium]|nr:bidirectional hydrogenase complex protein HoxU [Armatimonadota bacterium]